MIEYLTEGEWVGAPDNKQTIVCCDCGLAHKFEFRVVKGVVQWRSFRDEEKTAEVRAQDAMDKAAKDALEPPREYKYRVPVKKHPPIRMRRYWNHRL